VPREGKSSNWFTQGVESNSHVVYLTAKSEEVEFYEFRSALANNDQITARIIINAENLNSDNFRPDENYLDILERGCYTNCPLDVRDKQQEKILNDRRWKESIELCGKITHVGKIEASHFSKIVYRDVKENVFYDDDIFKIEDIKTRLKAHDAWLSGHGVFWQKAEEYKNVGFVQANYYLPEFNDYFLKGFFYSQKLYRDSIKSKSPEPH